MSAYLDGELTPAERARLEADLAAQPQLHTELDAYRTTKALIRALPEERPVRSFVLSAEMAAEADAARPAGPLVPLTARVERKGRSAPLLLQFGRGMAAAGIIGLAVVGASTLFESGGSGDDDGGAVTTMASMSENSALSANRDASAGSGPGATEAAVSPKSQGFGPAGTVPAVGGGDPASQNMNTPLAGTTTDHSPQPDSNTTIESAPSTAGGGQSPVLPPQSTEMITPNHAPKPDSDGWWPNWRQGAAIIFGILVAAGGGAWIAVAANEARRTSADQ
jgi:hypothetical protein